MKKTPRKLVSLLLMLLLALGMSVNVFADTPATGSITVGGAAPGQAFDAVQMFSAEVQADGSVTYKLNNGFKAFFTAATGLGWDTATDAAAYAYIQSLETDAAVADFAQKAMVWARANPAGLTAVTATVAEGATKAVLGGLPLGYYLFYPSVGSAHTTVAQLVSVPDEDADGTGLVFDIDITLKSEYPTIDKTVDGGKKAADVAVGDTVTFTLTSKVPDMTGFTAYTFRFVDTLSEGLTFGQISEVKVGGDTLQAGASETTGSFYTAGTAANAGNPAKTDLTIGFVDFYNNYKTRAGETITVTYTATLNEKAVSGAAGNTNSAVVQYSNNPDDDGVGTSIPSEVKVYTFGLTIDKFTGAYDSEGFTATRLAGAAFVLKAENTAAAAAIKLVKASADGRPLAYRVATPAEIAAGTGIATTITTPADGKIQITGLEAGTYYLFETAAPKGFNALDDTVKVVITPTYNAENGTFESVAITYNDAAKYGESETPGDGKSILTAADGVIPIQNNPGSLLPTTGGLGTVLFTVAGVAIVVAGAIWLCMRRKHGKA